MQTIPEQSHRPRRGIARRFALHHSSRVMADVRHIKIMKIVLISLVTFLMFLVLFLSPKRYEMVSAYSDNLWTKNGQWSNPFPQRGFLEGERTTYGIYWAWLGIDRQYEGPHWYAKLDTPYLLFYLVLALIMGSMQFFTLTYILKKPNKSASGNGVTAAPEP